MSIEDVNDYRVHGGVYSFDTTNATSQSKPGNFQQTWASTVALLNLQMFPY